MIYPIPLSMPIIKERISRCCDRNGQGYLTITKLLEIFVPQCHITHGGEALFFPLIVEESRINGVGPFQICLHEDDRLVLVMRTETERWLEDPQGATRDDVIYFETDSKVSSHHASQYIDV